LPSSLPMSHLPDDAAEVEGIPIATQRKIGRPGELSSGGRLSTTASMVINSVAVLPKAMRDYR